MTKAVCATRQFISHILSTHIHNIYVQIMCILVYYTTPSVPKKKYIIIWYKICSKIQVILPYLVGSCAHNNFLVFKRMFIAAWIFLIFLLDIFVCLQICASHISISLMIFYLHKSVYISSVELFLLYAKTYLC